MPMRKKVLALATILTSSIVSAHAAPLSANEKLVENALRAIFIQRDVSAIERYWAPSYLQHNPTIPDGREHLKDIVKSLPANFQWQPGFIAERGDIVMIHGRYVGWGPKPQAVTDIFRIKNGKIVEHWDTVQDEVPAAETKSGRAMFSPDEASE